MQAGLHSIEWQLVALCLPCLLPFIDCTSATGFAWRAGTAGSWLFALSALYKVFIQAVPMQLGLHGMQGQLVGVALSFLRNFGILSGASGVLGALSSGVASAALDDRFAVQRAQQKQVC